METLLKSSGEYSEVHVVDGNSSSYEVKSKLSILFEGLKDKGVTEMFFYYTGHGEYDQGEFIFPLADFDKARKKRTSLSNEDVDAWLRSVSAKLTVKLIDACFSGISYVKNLGDGEVHDYIKKSRAEFTNCYFLFSSSSNESSYQNSELSYFTRSFIESIAQHPDGPIRYKDIIDYISDDFEFGGHQTPYFVVQSSNTEVFCNVGELLRSTLLGSIRGLLSQSQPSGKGVAEIASVLDAIKKDAARYATEEDLKILLAATREAVAKYEHSEPFSSLYTLEISFEQDPAEIPRKKDIGEWVAQRTSVFAEPTTAVEEYDAYELDTSSLAASNLAMSHLTASHLSTRWLALRDIPHKSVKRFRTVTDGFRSTVEQDFIGIQVKAKPIYGNLPRCIAYILVLTSKTKIHFLWFSTTLQEKSWDDQRLSPGFNWDNASVPVKPPENAVDRCISIIRSFEEWASEIAISRFRDVQEGKDDVDEVAVNVIQPMVEVKQSHEKEITGKSVQRDPPEKGNNLQKEH